MDVEWQENPAILVIGADSDKLRSITLKLVETAKLPTFWIRYTDTDSQVLQTVQDMQSTTEDQHKILVHEGPIERFSVPDAMI